MSDTWYLSAAGLLAGLAGGRWSSLELVDLLLGRIAALDPPLNAVIALDPEGARAEARRLDGLRARGAMVGSLHGLPMTIKDTLEVAGLPASCGSPALRDYRPARDALSVGRLRAAGAIFLGKTNVPLFASDLQTWNELHGRTSNPHALDRTPGGSSGGAAAALAAGFTPVELGSDLSGSLRLPAHYCGVASLLPSAGLVPTTGSLTSPPGRRVPADVGVVGPLARTVGDLGLLLDVLLDPAPNERPGRAPAPAPAAKGRPFRIATWFEDPFCRPEPPVARLLEGVARALADGGHEVRDSVRPPVDAADLFDLHCGLVWAELGAGLPDDVWDYYRRRRDRRAGSGCVPAETDRLAAGLTISHRAWLRLKEQQMALRDLWAEFFRTRDVLLCPAAPTTAGPHDERRLDRRTQSLHGEQVPALRHSFWAGLASIAGLPALTVPVGLAPDGLPVGVQVVGPFLGDRTVLAVGAAVEALGGGFRPPPLLAGTWRLSAGG